MYFWSQISAKVSVEFCCFIELNQIALKDFYTLLNLPQLHNKLTVHTPSQPKSIINNPPPHIVTYIQQSNIQSSSKVPKYIPTSFVQWFQATNTCSTLNYQESRELLPRPVGRPSMAEKLSNRALSLKSPILWSSSCFPVASNCSLVTSNCFLVVLNSFYVECR